MPCEAHTIFHRGCGHVFLARTPESTAKESAPGTNSHPSPPNHPCNIYAPFTINISPNACAACTTLPPAFEKQELAADPTDVEGYDAFTRQWVEQVDGNAKMEGDLREGALRALKEKGEKGKGDEQVVPVGKQEVEEGLDLDWEVADGEELEGVGRA